MSTTVLTPEKKGHPLIQSMLNTRKRKRTRINNENLFFCWKGKTCLSVAMGNKLNSLIQITGEFDLKELSQDISCMKINILDIRCWRSRTFQNHNRGERRNETKTRPRISSCGLKEEGKTVLRWLLFKRGFSREKLVKVDLFMLEKALSFFTSVCITLWWRILVLSRGNLFDLPIRFYMYFYNFLSFPLWFHKLNRHAAKRNFFVK